MYLERTEIIKYIKGHMNLFDYFVHVYIFGSILNDNVIPNDIDLLLIYSDSDDTDMTNILYTITKTVNELFDLPIDMTVLTAQEEKDVNFIQRISPKYLRIK